MVVSGYALRANPTYVKHVCAVGRISGEAA